MRSCLPSPSTPRDFLPSWANQGAAGRPQTRQPGPGASDCIWYLSVLGRFYRFYVVLAHCTHKNQTVEQPGYKRWRDKARLRQHRNDTTTEGLFRCCTRHALCLDWLYPGTLFEVLCSIDYFFHNASFFRSSLLDKAHTVHFLTKAGLSLAHVHPH